MTTINNQTTQWDHISVEKDVEAKTATIILDRPEKMNTLSFIARSHLHAIFNELNHDDDVRVIIIKGAGEKAFTSGGNIAEFMEQHPAVLSELHVNVAAPERSPKPVIAQLQGYTFGVGLEIAMACDFRIAADNTLLALPEINLGMIPGSGGSQRVAKIVGVGRAKDMIMRGRRIPAEEAHQWGLLTTVTSPENVEEEVDKLVKDLVRLSPMTLSVLKRVINSSQDTPLSMGMEIEGFAYGMLRSTEDFNEGVQAFGNKVKPNFKGK
ncbi:enoyl-CoA hydratase/isomerase family protein [Bacillus sp. REN16]|uniref:enoyl-CoA hydratase/isomerase family protein n=1 Tax=Bacillus sp. REN16 TaxID=2887296 RepID=UPI001E4297C8|nr:enoyl-CoA hydratase-related protein [Bacillus sp. REN16]MCC3357951.1 enoyl-CoA hydratase/isomerase family protein [Bacillus sp. REN16]